MATIEHVQAAPATPRPQVNLADLVAHGGRIVVVGGRTTNFPDYMRDDPRLVFFDSTDPRTQTRELPSNARAVVMTQFVGHNVYWRFAEQAKARGIVFVPGTRTTGELRRMLEDVVKAPRADKPKEPDVDLSAIVVPQAAAPSTIVTEPIVTPEPPAAETTSEQRVAEAPPSAESGTTMKRKVQLQRGALIGFIREHGQLGVSRQVEAQRLLPLLQARGMNTTCDSIAQALWRLAQEQRQNGTRKTSANPKPNGHAAHAAPRVAPTFAQKGGDNGILDAIAEARKYVADVRAAADLLDELLPKLEAEVKLFRDKQHRATQVMAEFLS